MSASTQEPGPGRTKPAARPPRRGLLAGMRIRLKLVFLHTLFSLTLAGVLVLALRPTLAQVVSKAEAHEAGAILAMVLSERAGGPALGSSVYERAKSILGPGVTVRSGGAATTGLDAAQADAVKRGETVTMYDRGSEQTVVAALDPGTGEIVAVGVRLERSREAVVRLYALLTGALLVVYLLVALALELFVLPQHVYGPIRTILNADAALQEGRPEGELVPEWAMPADELGEIMRSRNGSIRALREHEAALGAALSELEAVAGEMKRKNHLLETARRNLADADRLASLGLMSAGIAHELNTPLSVLKGLVEKLAEQGPGSMSKAETALMLRVLGRLEGLSESLLDFARVRPSKRTLAKLRPLVEEAWELVRLDRGAARIELDNHVSEQVEAYCDPDRMVQVLVNLIRNAVDAIVEAPGRMDSGEGGRIVVDGSSAVREGAEWASLTITDNGPGIAPEVLSRLFEPFVTSRLDSTGTGLGLAVAEGIVKEHAGVILARNRSDGAGAVFEVMLPATERVGTTGGLSVEPVSKAVHSPGTTNGTGNANAQAGRSA